MPASSWRDRMGCKWIGRRHGRRHSANALHVGRRGTARANDIARSLRHGAQHGFALIALLAVLATGMLYFLVGQLDAKEMARSRDDLTVSALAQVKDALIGNAAAAPPNAVGQLPLPDLGYGISMYEGAAGSNFPANSKDYTVVGKTPWVALGIPVPRDGAGECVWYAVSGRFKSTPATSVPPNWDTPGQIDVIDGMGGTIASNVVVLIIAPGMPLDAQDRTLSRSSYVQCGGNYDARNYLDSFDIAKAIAGEVNYFPGSVNGRVAPNTDNKRFVMTTGDHYNDHFMFITVDDIFRPIVRRKDFADQISSLLDDLAFRTHLLSIAVSLGKGTDNIDCAQTSSLDNKKFCTNWKEMLLLTEPQPHGSVTINGLATSCSRVLFFGGQKTAAQVRASAADKGNPTNYLEGQNAVVFSAPMVSSPNFAGSANFSANATSADLVRCIP